MGNVLTRAVHEVPAVAGTVVLCVVGEDGVTAEPAVDAIPGRVFSSDEIVTRATRDEVGGPAHEVSGLSGEGVGAAVDTVGTTTAEYVVLAVSTAHDVVAIVAV